MLSSRSLQSILDALTAQIAVLDREGRILLVNDAWRRFADASGCTAGTCIGADYLALCRATAGEDASTLSEIAQGIQQLLAGSRASLDCAYSLREGEDRRRFQMRANRIEADGTVQFMVAIEEIGKCELAANAQLAAIEQQRNALAQEVHHSVKNTLHGIIGLLSLQLHDYPEAAPIIRDTIGKLQSYAIVFGLQSQSPLGNIDLGTMVEQICQAAETLTLTRIHCAPAAGLPVYMDQNQALPVALTINELIGNAIKHGVDDGDAWRVKVSAESNARGAWVRIDNAFAGPRPLLDWERGIGLRTGLDLVKSLLPAGSTLELKAAENRLCACLYLALLSEANGGNAP